MPIKIKDDDSDLVAAAMSTEALMKEVAADPTLNGKGPSGDLSGLPADDLAADWAELQQKSSKQLTRQSAVPPRMSWIDWFISLEDH